MAIDLVAIVDAPLNFQLRQKLFEFIAACSWLIRRTKGLPQKNGTESLSNLIKVQYLIITPKVNIFSPFCVA